MQLAKGGTCGESDGRDGRGATVKVQKVTYQATMRIVGSAAGVAVHYLRGELTPQGVERLLDAAMTAGQGQAVELEITLAGDEKSSMARQLRARLVNLSRHRITVRVT
jgi:hypothetical protein